MSALFDPSRSDTDTNTLTDLQHNLFSLTYDGKLHICPAGRDKPLHRVLDCGTGTGLWAMDFGASSCLI